MSPLSFHLLLIWIVWVESDEPAPLFVSSQSADYAINPIGVNLPCPPQLQQPTSSQLITEGKSVNETPTSTNRSRRRRENSLLGEANVPLLPQHYGHHQVPDVSWNKPLKKKIPHNYTTCITNDSQKEFTKGGNPKALALELVLEWVDHAWQQHSKDMVAKSFEGRYEYAEESSNSSGSADPALFKKELNSLDFDDRYSSPSFDYHLDSLAGYSSHISRMHCHNDNDFNWSQENQAYSPLDAKLTLSSTTATEDLLAPLAYSLPLQSSVSHNGVLSSLDNNTATQHQDAYAIHSPSNYTTHAHQHSYEQDEFDVSGFVQEILTDSDGYKRVIVGCDSNSGYGEYKYEEEDDFGFDENTLVEQEKGPLVGISGSGGGLPRRPLGMGSNRGGGCGGSGGKMGDAEQQQMAGGFYKPMYSFSCLIGLALKNSLSGELTVSEIYAFLCEHFPYFRVAPSGWKNSVRHNLSLNKCFQKIEVETPGCHGRKSCLWRLNPHRETKMDHELRKARERNEPLIVKAMSNPDDLDSIQAGTKGMPSTVRRRIVVPIEETSYVMKSATPKIIRRTPYSTALTNTSQRLSAGSSSSFVSNQPPQSKLSTSSGESVREAAARKLDYLLQQKSAIAYNPDMDEEISPPTQKRCSGGNTHSASRNEDFSDFVENSTPKRRSNTSNHSNGQSSTKSHVRSPLQPSSSHNSNINHQAAQQQPTAFHNINQQKEALESARVNCRENSDYYSRHNFHNYHQQPPPATRALPQRGEGSKSTSKPQAQGNKLVESMGWMGTDRSMSPLSYTSCSYDIVTEAIHNNILLDSALATSPCKRLM